MFPMIRPCYSLSNLSVIAPVRQDIWRYEARQCAPAYGSSAHRHQGWWWLLVLAASVSFGNVQAEEITSSVPAAADKEFFERRIRPVLVERCYDCHGEPETADGGLRLDTRLGWQVGGDSGPAIAPGDPDASLLIRAIRYEDRLQMPPDGRLPDATIRDFEKWVERGAYDPREESPLDPSSPEPDKWDWAAARNHWSYQLPQLAPLPPVKDATWPRGEMDQHILARLEQSGLRPQEDASREVLIRRLTFDLTGLPPTAEDMAAFVHDSRPEAYALLVDRLLASPEFGEHWGRHWLDIARYGESVTLRGLVFPEAWRYRDYVIQAFQDDRPLDQMIREHVAGDLLDSATAGERRKQFTATTFLALGNTNLEEQDKHQLRMDVVDEQLEAIGRAFLAQTIGCARCHDHKFDPLPTKDYYALASILRNVQTLEDANVSQWIERPLPLSDEEEAEFARHEQDRKDLEPRIADLKSRLNLNAPGAAMAVSPSQLPGIVVDDTEATRVGEWQASQFSGRYIGQGYLHDLNQGQGTKTLTFLPTLPSAGRYEVRLAYIPSSNRATNTLATVMSADGEFQKRVNQRLDPPLEGRFISLGTYQFELNGQGFVIVSNDDADGHVIVDAVQFLAEDSLPRPDPDAASSAELAEARKSLKQMEEELKQYQTRLAARPKVMSVRELEKVEDTAVHIRGSVHNLGEPVRRGFLQVATLEPLPEFPANESGRRELADWLVSPRNPLTARVMANRIWHWLFGAGLVRTTDNFGITGEVPSHPELLDLLAIRLQEDGWSAKRMIRRLVTSRTYRLSSVSRQDLLDGDPENRLWGRAFRKRLTAESLHDSMLRISGALEPFSGGNTIRPRTNADYGYQHEGNYRGIYAPVFRNALPDIFELFDFADPSVVTGRRPETISAPQALYMMNHPFVHRQANLTADRLLREVPEEEARIEALFQRTIGRSPTERERRICEEIWIQSSGTSKAAIWTQLVHSLFGSLDFRYID